MKALSEPCPVCKGCGMIWNPVWKQFWSTHDRLDGTEPLHEPEELECPVCNGAGKIPTDEGIKILALADEIRKELRTG